MLGKYDNRDNIYLDSLILTKKDKKTVSKRISPYKLNNQTLKFKRCILIETVLYFYT